MFVGIIRGRQGEARKSPPTSTAISTLSFSHPSRCHLIASPIDKCIVKAPLTRSQGQDTLMSIAGYRSRSRMRLRDVTPFRQLEIDASIASDWLLPHVFGQCGGPHQSVLSVDEPQVSFDKLQLLGWTCPFRVSRRQWANNTTSARPSWSHL